MGLIKSQHAVEPVAHPAQNLAQPGHPAFACGPECRVGHKKDAIAHGDRLVRLPFGERLDVGGRAAEVGPVADCVLDERGGFGDPDRLAPTREPVRQDEPGAFAALAAAGAVAEEVTEPIGVRLWIIIGAGHPGLVFVDREPARQVAPVGVVCHQDGLELGLGKMTPPSIRWPGSRRSEAASFDGTGGGATEAMAILSTSGVGCS